MPVQYYLSVAGIGGDSLDPQHRGFFDVASYSLDESTKLQTETGGAAAISPPSFGPLEISFNDEAGLTGFLNAMARGTALSGASLVEVRTSPDGSEQEIYRVNLADVLVTSVSENQDGGYMVSLGYDQIGVTTHPLNPDGSLGAPQTFNYDVAAEKVTSAVPDTPGDHAAFAVNPSTFYAAIDGLNGGVTGESHHGWFELSSFNLEAVNQAVSQTLGGAKASFDPITLHLSSQAALTGLMTDMARGAVISDVRIEGLTPVAGGAPQAVYDLDLGEVHIADVVQSADGGLDVTLAYGAIKLTTEGLGPTGTTPQTSSFTWNTATNSASATFATPEPGSTYSGAHPDAFYLSVSDVAGPSVSAAYPGAFNVTGFHFDTAAAVSVAGAGTTEVSAPDFGPLQVSFADDAGLANFLSDLTSGKHLAGASLVGVIQGAHGEEEAYRVNLADVLVTGVTQNSDGGYTVNLDYQQIGITTHGLNPDGSMGAATTFAYDVATRAASSPPPDVTAPSTALAVHPSTFFAAIDGMNGGVTDPAHKGWFQLGGFNVDALATAVMSQTGGLSSSQASLDPITVHLTSQAGLTQLMSAFDRGANISDIRIEGMTTSGDAPQAVYDLDLANVHISQVSQSSDGGVDVTLAYSAVKLTTQATDPSGGPTQTSTFTWNLATESASANFPSAMPGPGAGGGHPESFYLSLTGASGDSIAEGYRGFFNVENFSLQSNATVSTVAGGAEVATPHYGPLQVTLADQTGLASFLTDLSKGEVLSGASLVGVQPGTNGSEEVYRVNLADVVVTGVSAGSDGSYVVSLAYSQIGVTTRGMNPDGTLTQPSVSTYDVSIRKPAYTPPPNVQPSSLAAPIHPTTFFAAMDGLNGGAVDADHRGWFQLDGFNLDAVSAALTNATSGIQGSTPTLEPITLQLPNDASLTQLMALVSSGRVIDDVRIEGTSPTAGGAPAAVYDVDLANVHITDVTQGSGGGLEVTLAYSAIRVTTQATDPSGATQTNTFSWNLATNSTGGTFPTPYPGSGSGSDVTPPAAPTGLADASILNGYINAAHEAGSALTGTAEAGSTVSLYDNGGTTAVATATADSSGHFSFDLSGLADGAHSLTVTATDASGNVSAASSALDFTVDTHAPLAPSALANASIVNGYINAAHETASALTGTAEAGSTVSLYDNGGTTVVATATADSSGHFSFDLSGLADGAHSLTVTATDASGNVSAASDPLAFTVDTQAPLAPSALADASIVNGYVNATHEAASALTGAAEAGSTVSLYDNGGTTAVATVIADSSGHFSFDLSSLSDGAHSLTVTATDAAGNISAASDPLGFTVDTQAPLAPSALADASIVNGYVNAAHEAASALTGAAEAGSTVSLYDNGGTTAVATVIADSSGHFSFDLSSLADGAHSLMVTATDAAGNISAGSDPLGFKVDTQPPVAPSALADASIVNGYVNAAHEAASVLTGAAEAGATVSLYDDGASAPLATAVADASGHFSFDLSGLADAAYSLTVTATDAAGNVSASSSPLAFTVDTHVAAPGVALALDSGVPGDGVTNDGALTLSGIETGATVEYSIDGGKTWAQSFSASEGQNAVEVRQTDLAGNVSTPTAFSFTLDTHAPNAPTSLNLDPTSDSGIPFDRITNHNQVLIDGKAEAGSTVTLYDSDGHTVLGTGVADASGEFQVMTSTLADGQHQIYATATDLAGNTGAVSSGLGVTIDTTAPVPLVQDVASDGGTTLSGSSEPLSAVFVYDSGVLVGTSIVDLNGKWSLDVHATGNTIHDYTVKGVDLAGNVGASPGETLYSPAANKALVGGAGDDVLISRPNDTLTGGGGEDTFVFNPHFGKVTVADFAAGDHLAFDHSVFSSYAQVMADARQVGHDTVISDGHGDVLTLHGVALGSLDQSSFLFI